MDVVRIITAEEGPSIASLFEYCFVSFSNGNISHECINFRTQNPVRMELVGVVDESRCFGVGGARI